MPPYARPRERRGAAASKKPVLCCPTWGRRSVPGVRLAVTATPDAADVDPRTLLVQFLRENLRLTGTHVGCDTSQCGACVVHLDGKAVKSCTALAVMADGHEVKTIQGLAAGRAPLHPIQEAFR